MAKRRRYSDDERAMFIAMLDKEGYPDTLGALKKVSDFAGIHTNVLRRWWKGTQNPPPTELVTQKKEEINERLRQVVHKIIDVLPDAIEEASPRDLFTGLGIAIDKLQLVSGEPTERTANTHDITGSIDIREDIQRRLGRIASRTGTESIPDELVH